MKPLANKHTLKIPSHCLQEDTVNTDGGMFARLPPEIVSGVGWGEGGKWGKGWNWVSPK